MGARAVPGNYRAVLRWGKVRSAVPFTILADPRSSATDTDFGRQFMFVQGINDKLSETHTSIKEIRAVREQLKALDARIDSVEHKDIYDKVHSILKEMQMIEEALYQTKNQSGQDPLNFPIQLNNRLAAVKNEAAIGDFAPTQQAVEVAEELTKAIDERLQQWDSLKSDELSWVNDAVREAKIDLIEVPLRK